MDRLAFEGEGERFDEAGLGTERGMERNHGKFLPLADFDDGIAHRVPFSENDEWLELLGRDFESRDLKVVVDVVEPFEVDLATFGDIENRDDGEVVVFAPVHAEGVVVVRNGEQLRRGRRAGVHVAEDHRGV